MFPMVDDPSAAGAMVSSSFPDADAYGNGDSDDLDFPADPNSNASFSAAPATAAAAAAASAGGAGPAGSGERRPLFQRLWTDEDEIVILRAFAEFTAQRGTSFASHQYDTTPFYEDMRGRLQTDFTKSQLVEKLRRLKRKYRNCVDRLRVAGVNFSFRSPHEQAIFEIARTIWRPASDKHGRDSDDEGNNDDALAIDAAAAAAAAAAGARVNGGESAKSPSSKSRRGRRRRTGDFPVADASAEALPPAPMPALTAEDALPSFPQPTTMDGTITMDPAAAGLPAALSAAAATGAALSAATPGSGESTILAPLFKEMIRAMLNISASSAPLGLEPPPPIPGLHMEGDKWRQQRILELEVYLRRIALLQEQARAALEELRSAPPHPGAAGGMNT